MKMHVLLLVSLVSLPLTQCFAYASPRRQQRQPCRLMMYQEENPVKVSSVLVLTVGIVGVFGLSSVSFLQDLPRTIVPSEKAQLKNESPDRGAMTRLTKREVNNKLNQVPAFYVKNSNNGVYIDNGNNADVGYFFIEKEDCEKYAEASKLNKNDIRATTLGSHFS